jgi:HK97 gp10 family phage protein
LATEFSFSFNADQLKLGPKELDRKLNRAAFATVKYHETRSEAWMKHKAPWKDRTTNARNGLFSKAAKISKGVFWLIFAHSVTYGIYLERGTRYMKARPIIAPALREYGPKVMRTFNKILDRL